MDQKTARFRVTGAMFQNLVGRDVCVVGTALSVAPDGKRIHLRCVDGHEIDANLLSPLQTSPENCIVEIQGRIKTSQANELDASAEPIIYSKEATEKFDLAMYAQAIQFTAQLDRFYQQLLEA